MFKAIDIGTCPKCKTNENVGVIDLHETEHGRALLHECDGCWGTFYLLLQHHDYVQMSDGAPMPIWFYTFGWKPA